MQIAHVELTRCLGSQSTNQQTSAGHLLLSEQTKHTGSLSHGNTA